VSAGELGKKSYDKKEDSRKSQHLGHLLFHGAEGLRGVAILPGGRASQGFRDGYAKERSHPSKPFRVGPTGRQFFPNSERRGNLRRGTAALTVKRAGHVQQKKKETFCGTCAPTGRTGKTRGLLKWGKNLAGLIRGRPGKERNFVLEGGGEAFGSAGGGHCLIKGWRTRKKRVYAKKETKRATHEVGVGGGWRAFLGSSWGGEHHCKTKGRVSRRKTGGLGLGREKSSSGMGKKKRWRRWKGMLIGGERNHMKRKSPSRGERGSEWALDIFRKGVEENGKKKKEDGFRAGSYKRAIKRTVRGERKSLTSLGGKHSLQRVPYSRLGQE